MAARQNITLSLDKEMLREIKHLAVEKGASVSGLIREQFEAVLQKRKRRQQAAKRLMRRMEKGFDLGSNGKIHWTRGDIYER